MKKNKYLNSTRDIVFFQKKGTKKQKIIIVFDGQDFVKNSFMLESFKKELDNFIVCGFMANEDGNRRIIEYTPHMVNPNILNKTIAGNRGLGHKVLENYISLTTKIIKLYSENEYELILLGASSGGMLSLYSWMQKEVNLLFDKVIACSPAIFEWGVDNFTKEFLEKHNHIKSKLYLTISENEMEKSLKRKKYYQNDCKSLISIFTNSISYKYSFINGGNHSYETWLPKIINSIIE